MKLGLRYCSVLPSLLVLVSACGASPDADFGGAFPRSAGSAATLGKGGDGVAGAPSAGDNGAPAPPVPVAGGSNGGNPLVPGGAGPTGTSGSAGRPLAQGGSASQACDDQPPPANAADPREYSCAEQVGWGKCSETWMQGFCRLSCGTCIAAAGGSPSGGGSAAGTPGTGGISDAEAGSYTTLVDTNATPEAKGLMRYLSSQYGKKIIAGHQCSYTWATAESEYNQIKQWTGKAPAIRGFDLMDVINGWGSGYTEKAVAWGKSGGIVTMNWHWRLGGADFYSPAYHAGGTSFPNGDPTTNTTINSDLKKLGDELQKLADAKIPVLWRPLHEPPGNWFWWHTAGAGQYVKLWKHQYNYLVNTRGLHNLIWVYSGADNSGYKDGSWYPGNEVVDIAAVDGYGGNWQTYFDGLKGLSGGKRMVGMTEGQGFPDWNASRTYMDALSWNNEIFNGMGQDKFRQFYGDAHTVTLDDLPTAGGKAAWDQMLPH